MSEKTSVHDLVLNNDTVKKKIPTFLLWISVAIVVIYFLIDSFLVNHILFHPSKDHDPYINVEYEDIFMKGGLHGWYVPSLKKTNKTFLFFHGNAGNISHREYPINFMRKIANVFIFDYSGYGKSKGSPSEKQLYKDGQTAYDFITNRCDPSDLYFYGISLGGAVAIETAIHNNCAGVILQSTFCGTDDFVWSILKPICKWFPSGKKVKHIKKPILVLHSEEDEIVPFFSGRKLYDQCNSPKDFMKIHGGHNSTNFSDDMKSKIIEFMNK